MIKKQNKLTYLNNKLKKVREELNIYYGSKDKKISDTIIGSMITGFFLIWFYIIFYFTKDSFSKVIFGYNVIFLIVAIIFWFSNYFYSRRKNSEKYRKVKYVTFYLSMICLVVLFVPGLIIIGAINAWGNYFNKAYMAQNFLAVLLELVLYMLALLVCVGDIGMLMQLSFFQYFIYNIIVYVFTSFFRWLIRKIYITGYFSKYTYNNEIKGIYKYSITILGIICGVGGLFLIKDYFYILMPILIFIGMEQVCDIIKQKKEEKIYCKYIINLLDEMIVLNSIILCQIEDFSCLNINFKLSFGSVDLETYKNFIVKDIQSHRYLFYKIKTNKKVECINKMIKSCNVIITTKYNCYIPENHQMMFKDINIAIEDIATYIVKYL